MTKRVILFIITVVLLGGIGIFGFRKLEETTPSKVSPTEVPSPHSSPTNTSLPYCSPQDLNALITIEGAAGNIYGTITLKNTSAQLCQILGGNIGVFYDTGNIKNITVTAVGQTQTKPIVLTQGQTIYSQVHYPNGPQCQSLGIQTVPVIFTYKISPTSTISFKNKEGSETQTVQACKSSKDITDIQVWNISTEPITP